MAENKTRYIVNAQLLNKSRQESTCSCQGRHEKSATSHLKHASRFAQDLDINISYWIDQEISDLKYFSPNIIRIWIGYAEFEFLMEWY